MVRGLNEEKELEFIKRKYDKRYKGPRLYILASAPSNKPEESDVAVLLPGAFFFLAGELS